RGTHKTQSPSNPARLKSLGQVRGDSASPCQVVSAPLDSGWLIAHKLAAIERLMDGDGGAHTAALPSEQVLRWVAGVVGGMRVVSIANDSRSPHRPSGTFRLRFEGPSAAATARSLRVSVPHWITVGMVITNARALRLEAECARGTVGAAGGVLDRND